MRLDVALLSCSLAVSFCWSEAVNITGTVRDSSSKAGIKDAVVSLAVRGLSDTTDASGAFAITGQTNLAGPHAASAAAFSAPVLVAGGLRLGLATPERVVISGFMVDGRQGLRIEQRLAAGEHLLGLDSPRRGVVLYRVRAAGSEYLLRQAQAGTGGSARLPAGRSAGGESARLAKAEAFSDTLVVTRSGYATKRVAVTAATATGVVIDVAAAGGPGGTVTDADGNVYHTVTIGTQVWTVEDLRTTKYRDGTPIPLVTDNTAWGNLTTPGYCFYNNSTVPAEQQKWGALYNWYAVNSGKLAPAGWHVPKDAEWETLVNYLIGKYNLVAKPLCAKTDWRICSEPDAPGNDLGKNNASGFTGLPSGCRTRTGDFSRQGSYGYWWGADASVWLDRGLDYARGSLDRHDNGYWQGGMSVRLLRD